MESGDRVIATSNLGFLARVPKGTKGVITETSWGQYTVAFETGGTITCGKSEIAKI
jgi:hypothetical protein